MGMMVGSIGAYNINKFPLLLIIIGIAIGAIGVILSFFERRKNG